MHTAIPRESRRRDGFLQIQNLNPNTQGPKVKADVAFQGAVRLRKLRKDMWKFRGIHRDASMHPWVLLYAKLC